jgi:DNA-binding transcriptional ArsR family regulator
MPEQTAELDRVFRALSDPTRRQVVERLGSGSASTSDLARPFAMALPSFTQHLEVLERAGLVTSTKTGRVRTYELVPAALGVADGWLDQQRRLWARRLDQLDDLLRTLDTTTSDTTTSDTTTYDTTTYDTTTYDTTTYDTTTYDTTTYDTTARNELEHR